MLSAVPMGQRDRAGIFGRTGPHRGIARLVQRSAARADQERSALGLPASTFRASAGRLCLPMITEGQATEQDTATGRAHQHQRQRLGSVPRGTPQRPARAGVPGLPRGSRCRASRTWRSGSGVLGKMRDLGHRHGRRPVRARNRLRHEALSETVTGARKIPIDRHISADGSVPAHIPRASSSVIASSTPMCRATS
jgi:hypothetical protein